MSEPDKKCECGGTMEYHFEGIGWECNNCGGFIGMEEND